MKFLLFISVFTFFSFLSFSQSASTIVYTSDIDNFWICFDSVQTTQDSAKQAYFIQKLYIDKGTEGLKAFMEAREYTIETWIQAIRNYPKFWKSIRKNTLMVKEKTAEIEKSIQQFKELYPNLQEAKLYFTIGCLSSGGTTSGDKVLVGCEVAMGDSQTDVSEFPNDYFAKIFQNQSVENIIRVNVHEYVHTQQKTEGNDLLCNAIKEGACDFITELVLHQPLATSYALYGKIHEDSLKKQFKAEMFTDLTNRWLYNGESKVPDLGYFMGYQICKYYYQAAANKTQAIQDIIEINLNNEQDVLTFLKKSNYYKGEKINPKKLKQSFEKKCPYILRLEPITNNSQDVATSLQTVTIIFSEKMGERYSFEPSDLGPEHIPFDGIIGFSEDRKSFSLKCSPLEANYLYEVMVTSRSFKSEKGYPLKDYKISFRTQK